MKAVVSEGKSTETINTDQVISRYKMMLTPLWCLRVFSPSSSSSSPFPRTNKRAGGDSHLLRTGAMPALDEHGKEVRKRSPVFSSSGSESEIASSSGTTPARSRTSSRSSTRTTPARSRTNSRGSLGIVTPGRSRAARNSARGLPPQRGTAKNRGGIGGGGPVPRDHRRSPPSENSSGDGKSYRRTSSGSSGGEKSSSGSRRDPEKGGKGGRTEHARRVSAPHSSSSSKSAANGDGEGSGVSGVVGERDEAQSAEGMMKHKKGLYKQSATTAKSMPNMADMLVAPLSRPIPTDSVGYWYNNGQDTEQSSRSRSRSQSATDCETSPVHVAGSGQPSRSRRQNGARPLSYVSKTTGARSNTHPHSLQLDEHANEGMHDDAREARLPSPPPPTALVRGSSTPGKQPKSGAKVGRHHRRKSSGQQSEEDLLALSRSHRAAARDRLNGASSALPSTSKRYQSPPRESDKVKVSARHTKSGGRERKSKHGRHSATKSKEKDSRTSGDDGWKWSANDNPEPTNISGQPDDSATGGRAREDAGNTASHNERNRTKLRGGVSAEGSNGAGPRQASEKTRVAPRESLENDVALNARKAAAKWQRVASMGEAGVAADASAAVTNAAVIRTRRTAEAKAAEAAAALKAREEADAKVAEAAEKLAAAKAAAMAMSRASPMAAKAVTKAAAPVTATAKRTEAKEEVGARPGIVVLDDKSVPVVRSQLPLVKKAVSKATATSEPGQPLPITAAAAAATTTGDSVVVEGDNIADESAAVSVHSDVPHVSASSPPRRKSGERELGWSEMAALATAQAKAAREARQANDEPLGRSDSAEMLSDSSGEEEDDVVEGQYVGNGRGVEHGSDSGFHEREGRETSEEMYLVRHSGDEQHDRHRAFIMHEVICSFIAALHRGEECCDIFFCGFVAQVTVVMGTRRSPSSSSEKVGSGDGNAWDGVDCMTGASAA